jgi:hypothetical protein
MLEILGGKLHDLSFLDRFGNGINKCWPIIEKTSHLVIDHLPTWY